MCFLHLQGEKIRVHVGTAVFRVRMKFSCFGGLQRMWPVRGMGMGEEIESVWIDKNCEMGQMRNQIAKYPKTTIPTFPDLKT
jgi:hypothetical protein